MPNVQELEPDEIWISKFISESGPRRRVPPSHISVTGRVSTRKAACAQSTESTLEQDFLYLLDADSQVVRYVTQPFSFAYMSASGRKARYTPDVFVQYKDTAYPLVVFEVKPSDIVVRDRSLFQARWQAAKTICNERGWRFRVVTEAHIRSPYLTNLKFLRRFRDLSFWHIDTGTHKTLLDAISSMAIATPNALLASCNARRGDKEHLLPLLWHAIATGLIGADLKEPLTMESEIWAT